MLDFPDPANTVSVYFRRKRRGVIFRGAVVKMTRRSPYNTYLSRGPEDGRDFASVISLNLLAERRDESVCRAYEENRSAVYRDMIAIGLDAGTAQNLTQETFLSLFESLSKAQRIERLRPRLVAAASRIAVRHLERRLLGEAILNVPDVAELISGLEDREEGPEQSSLSAERKHALAAAMQALSPQQGVCLHLRAEGPRYREIAEATSLSVRSVAEFLRRAINRLRSVLDGK